MRHQIRKLGNDKYTASTLIVTTEGVWPFKYRLYKWLNYQPQFETMKDAKEWLESGLGPEVVEDWDDGDT